MSLQKLIHSLSKTNDFVEIINSFSKTDDFTETHKFINKNTLFHKNL